MTQRESRLSRKIQDALIAKGYSPIQTELAWAAGLFDGEGTCYLWEGRKPRLAIGQVDDFVLIRFKASVGDLGNLNGPYSYAKRPNAQPHYLYTCNGAAVLVVAELINPYLSPVKRAQIQGVLNDAKRK